MFCKGSCLDTKQTSKNIADTTFKGIKSILHDQYLLERYPKLGGQSRITYAVATTFIFARFVKDILGVTNLYKKHYNSNINILSIRQWEVFDKKIILKSFIKMLKITTTFLKISLIYFYTGIFLEFCLNFYGLLKAAWEGKSYHITFVFVIVFSITIRHTKSTLSIFSGWELDI